MHLAAREMVQVAEQGLTVVKTLDPTWQEMLNHATLKVCVFPQQLAAFVYLVVLKCALRTLRI